MLRFTFAIFVLVTLAIHNLSAAPHTADVRTEIKIVSNRAIFCEFSGLLEGVCFTLTDGKIQSQVYIPWKGGATYASNATIRMREFSEKILGAK